MALSKEIAKTMFPKREDVSSCGRRAAAIRFWALYFANEGSLLPIKQGVHQKVSSLIEDEDIRDKCEEYLAV